MDALASSSSQLADSESGLFSHAGRAIIVFGLALLFGALGVFYAYNAFGRPSMGIDDADIFLVYARHLAEGNGFVYNVGGEHVEGFSSMLWTLLMAPFYWVTTRPEPLLVVFNLLLTTAALTALLLFVDQHIAPRFREANTTRTTTLLTFPAIVVLIWTFAAPGYLTWTTLSLMETGLWSALILAATVCALSACFRKDPSLRQGILISTIIGFLVLTRPEATLWGLVFIGFYFLSVLRQTGRVGSASVHSLVPLAGYLAAIAGLTLFRLAYFGYPFPNTYYAKVSPDRLYSLIGGSKYLFNFVSSNGFVLAGFLAAIAGVLRFLYGLWRKRAKALTAGSGFDLAFFQVSAIILVGAVIPVLVGGDHFGEYRFYQPLWPLLPIAALCGLSYVYKPLGLERLVAALRPYRFVLLGPLFLLLSWSNEQKWHELEVGELIGQFGVAESGRATGEHMNAFFEPIEAPEVGVIAAGGVKLMYTGRINDLLGLNNVAMAHSTGDRRGYTGHAAFQQDVLYTQLPEVILPYPPATDLSEISSKPHPFTNGVLDDIMLTPRFLETYPFAILERTSVDNPLVLGAHFRSDYLDELLDSGLFAIHPGFATSASQVDVSDQAAGEYASPAGQPVSDPSPS